MVAPEPAVADMLALDAFVLDMLAPEVGLATPVLGGYTFRRIRRDLARFRQSCPLLQLSVPASLPASLPAARSALDTPRASRHRRASASFHP
jgi:hypothetical protein